MVTRRADILEERSQLLGGVSKGRIAKPLYGLKPVSRVRIPVSLPDSLNRGGSGEGMEQKSLPKLTFAPARLTTGFSILRCSVSVPRPSQGIRRHRINRFLSSYHGS